MQKTPPNRQKWATNKQTQKFEIIFYKINLLFII